MHDISSFRGMAGEVVRSFVRPGVFLTTIPIILFWALVGVLFFFLGRALVFPIGFFLIIAASSLLVGRFALPASRGELGEGFFSRHLERGEAFAYAGRYCILTVFWAIPVVVIGWLAIGNLGSLVMAGMGMGGGFSLMQAGFQGIVLALLLLVCIFAPTLCCIVATYTESFGETFSFEPWAWLFQDRRSDLLPFYSSLFGGVFLFWAIYFIPLLVIAILAFKISMGFGMVTASLIYILPAAVSPILIGRLSGAFIAGEAEIGTAPEEEENFRVGLMGNADPNVAKTAASSFTNQTQAQQQAPRKRSINDIVQKIYDLPKMDLMEAIHQAELKHGGQTPDVYSTIELAYLYQALGKMEQAIKTVSKAIQQTLYQKLHREALKLYGDFVKFRDNFVLEADELELLGDLLLKELRFTDASWCLFLSMQTSNEMESLIKQKHLLSVADAAGQATKYKEAFAIYVFFMKNFPSSTLLDYAKKGAQEAKSKLDS